jgi:hypothetical protein
MATVHRAFAVTLGLSLSLRTAVLKPQHLTVGSAVVGGHRHIIGFGYTATMIDGDPAPVTSRPHVVPL